MKKILTSFFAALIFLSVFYIKTFSQSSNVNPPRLWYHGYSINAVYVNGNYAYFGSDIAMNVLDVSNPSSVKAISQIIVPQNIQWITYQNGKAYIAAGDSGLRIIDVSNPLQPIEIGFYHTQGKALAVSVSGNFAYVAADTAGVRVLDVSNPVSPFEVGFFDLGNTKAYNVVVSGNYAYIAYGTSGLQIVDVSNPSSPVSASSLNWSTTIYNVFVSGNYAYAVDGDFRIVDVTNPLSPVQSSVNSGLGSYSSLFVSGSYAYLGDIFSFSDYEIWDVSNSSSPSIVGNYFSDNYAMQSIYVSGTRAYFLDEGTNPGDMNALDIVDVSTASSPSLLGKFRQAQMFFDVCSSGNYVYTIEWEPPTGGMIGVYDITNPSLPQQIGVFYDSSFFSPSGYFELFVSGNYLYLTATQTQTGYGLKIIDISTPSAPNKVGSYSIGSATAHGVYVSGNYAYVCFDNLGMYIIDVSNPASPVAVGSIILSGGFPALEIFVSGNYAYVADNSNNLHIVDVSNPATPVEVSSFLLPANSRDIYVSGNYAYVATGGQGLKIIDVSNPASPILTGSYSAVSNDPRLKLYKSGNYVYLSDFLNGLQGIDIVNPSLPVQTGYYYDISGYARNIYADNNNIYLVSDYGLYIFHNPPFIIIGINNASAYKENISIFPNPSSGVFDVNVNTSFDELNISVFNVIGEKIKTISLKEKNFCLDLSDMQMGIYYLNIVSDNFSITKHIAVVK